MRKTRAFLSMVWWMWGYHFRSKYGSAVRSAWFSAFGQKAIENPKLSPPRWLYRLVTAKRHRPFATFSLDIGFGGKPS